MAHAPNQDWPTTASGYTYNQLPPPNITHYGSGQFLHDENVHYDPKGGFQATAVTQPGSDHGRNIPDWPNEPKKLKKGFLSIIVTALADLGSLSVPICFILVAVLGRILDGKKVEGNEWGKTVISFTKYVSQMVLNVLVGNN